MTHRIVIPPHSKEARLLSAMLDAPLSIQEIEEIVGKSRAKAYIHHLHNGLDIPIALSAGCLLEGDTWLDCYQLTEQGRVRATALLMEVGVL